MKNLRKMMILIISIICLMMISACEETTSSNITLIPNFGNATDVVGAKLTMTNNSGKKSHVYKQTAKGTAVIFHKIVPGTYTLTIEHKDYFDYRFDNVTVHSTVPEITADLIRKGPAGGYVFYDKGNSDGGWRFLEVAPAFSEFNAEWGAYTGSWDTDNYRGIDVSGTSTGISTGKANTQAIVTRLLQLGETDCAAQRCVALNIGGKNDWFLPSMDELNLMYVNLHQKGLGDFGNGTDSEFWMNWVYWSSSQGNNFDLTWG